MGTTISRITGDALHRRSLYTFWKRTVAAADDDEFRRGGARDLRGRETRTNTPLQSLNLMNDVTYLEAARKMAERMMGKGGSTPADRIAYGFEWRLARQTEPPRGGDPSKSSATIATGFNRSGRRHQIPDPGRSEARRDPRRPRARRLLRARQPDPESRFDPNEELACWTGTRC